MRCEGCGVEALAFKTVRWRKGVARRKFALCDGCYYGLAASVWIVRGPRPVWGQCRGCGEWFSVRELEDRVGGGRWDSPSGICPSCTS